MFMDAAQSSNVLEVLGESEKHHINASHVPWAKLRLGGTNLMDLIVRRSFKSESVINSHLSEGRFPVRTC